MKKFVVNYYSQSGPFSSEARELFSTRRDLRKVIRKLAIIGRSSSVAWAGRNACHDRALSTHAQWQRAMDGLTSEGDRR